MSLRRACLLLCFGACLQPLAGMAQAPITFVLHNLHFQRFSAFGFRASEVVHAVHQDAHGRLWIGTENGLYLYDGQEVRAFQVDPLDPAGLPHDFVKAIAEGPDGRIWLGTWGGGLAWFDESNRQVRAVDVAQARDGEAFDPKIWSMDVDRMGRVWLGTFDAGLFRYDPATDELLAVYQPAAGEPTRAGRIDTLFIDGNDRAWFAPDNAGLHVVDITTLDAPDGIDSTILDNPRARDSASDIGAFPDGRLFMLYDSALRVVSADGSLLREYALQTTVSDSSLMEAVAYRDDALLIGTAERLWYFALESGEHFPIPAGTWPGAIEPSIVWDMDLGENGDLLVAGNTGVWINTAAARQFWTTAISHPDSSAIVETRAMVLTDDALYLNSENRIYEIAFDGQLERVQQLDARLVAEPAFGYPLWMEAAAKNCFWAGADTNVMHFCGTGHDGKGTESVVIDHSAHVLLADNEMQRLLFQVRGGIGYIDMQGDPLTVTTGAEEDRKHPTVHLSFGADNDIWSGTFSGLHRYDRTTLARIPAFAPDAGPTDWSRTFINAVHPLGTDEILVGTANGLYRAQLDRSGAIRAAAKLFRGQPLESIDVSAILQRAANEVVLVTTAGYVKYQIDSGATALLSFDNGAPNYQVYGSGFRQYGKLAILSGMRGPVLFDLDALRFEAPAKRLVISDVLSFRKNQPRPWPTTGPLEFLHEDRVVRFRFGMLDYLSPEDNHYEIRLRGFTDEWLDVGRLGEFNITGLAAGRYRLDVRARDGMFPVAGEASLAFTVLPPWWRTWWAYALYAFFVIGASTTYILSLQRKIRRERDISQRLREADRIKSHFLSELEEKVDLATQDLRHAVEALEIKNVELDAAQQRALDASRLKSEFLANMSHEIRTPMNGILGFTQLLAKSELDHDQRDHLETIEKSATSLLGIINDVLDVSKVEAGKLMIDSTGYDLRQCVSDTLEALTPIAYEKNLELIGHLDEDLPAGLRGDPVRLRQMITNLVGNAVKFTDTGHVIVHVARHADAAARHWLRISVTDTGRGITMEDRERLFQAFERGNVSLVGRYTGTGLGLVITKKLCEAMGGQITLESTPGIGTCITLELPLVPDRNPENHYGYGTPLAGRRILLVDADAHSREALRARYVHFGAQVVAVAAVDEAHDTDADLAIIAIGRREVGDVEALRATCAQLPPSQPRLCLASTVDHDTLRSLSDACCKAACVPKVGYKEGQLRRILALLGIPWGEAEPEDATDGMRLRGLRVIVADDNRINRYFLKKILELHGAKVTETDCGTAVLRALENPREGFDIALLDVHMPDIDGLEVARRIRAGGLTQLPLLAVSANVQPETYEAAVAAGINDYLLKPVDEKKLVEAILEWTGRETVEG